MRIQQSQPKYIPLLSLNTSISLPYLNNTNNTFRHTIQHLQLNTPHKKEIIATEDILFLASDDHSDCKKKEKEKKDCSRNQLLLMLVFYTTNPHKMLRPHAL